MVNENAYARPDGKANSLCKVCNTTISYAARWKRRGKAATEIKMRELNYRIKLLKEILNGIDLLPEGQSQETNHYSMSLEKWGWNACKRDRSM